MLGKTEFEQSDPTIIGLNQRFPLFGLQPTIYTPDGQYESFKSKFAFEAGVGAPLLFYVSLGRLRPFHQHYPDDNKRLYVYSDLSQQLEDIGLMHAKPYRHIPGVRTLGPGSCTQYSYARRARSGLSRLRLRVYDEESKIYEAKAEQQELEYGELEFSHSFRQVSPPGEIGKRVSLLFTEATDLEALKKSCEAEFILLPKTR